MRTRRFRRGEVIFHAGDPGDALFIIVSGEVKIAVPVRDRRRGDPRDARHGRRLRRAGPARRRAALGDAPPRSCATETVVLPRERFRELIATEPAVRDALLASLAGELRRLTTTSRSCTSSTSPAAWRRGSSGSPREAGPVDADGAIRLRATLTQADLASMVGCTRQSVNKLLGQFTDDGLIRLERDGIVGHGPARA